MNYENLSGTWVGQYTFGDGYPKSYKGKSVLFSVEMTIDDGELTGNCFDNDHPFDEPATLEGSVENDLISFVKRYPHAFVVDDDGKTILMPDEPSHEVYYNGELIGGMFRGSWAIILGGSTEDNVEFGGSGTWTMQRE